MKKTLFTIFALCILTIPVYAQDNNNDSLLNLSASHSLEVAPDRANIKFYVENSGLNVSDLKKKNDEIIQKTLTQIKKELVEGEEIKTIAFSVNNIYSYRDRVRIFQKYEVKNGFEVTLKDINKVSKIIDIAMNNGIKNIGGLSFYLHDSESVCNKSIAEVINIAKNRAQYISTSTGILLGKIKNVSPSCYIEQNHVSRRYYNNSMVNFSADSAETYESTEFEPGKIKVNSSVNMTYYLK